MFLAYFLCLLVLLLVGASGLRGPTAVGRVLRPGSLRVSSLPNLVDEVSVGLYDAQLLFSGLVDSQLSTASPISLGVLYAAGLLTSFSPCVVSLLPLTLMYLGTAGEDATREEKLVKSAFYAAGLASTLAFFGLAAAFLGQLFGSSATNTAGSLPSLIFAVISITMGLNLLDVIRINFPSPGEDDSVMSFANKLPPAAQAFVLGGSSALVSSPCSSPVLTSLLAFVASSGKPFTGACFLFVYSLGYATPVVAAGAISGAANSLYSSRGLPFVNLAMASLLVGFGTFSALDVVFSAK